VEGVDEIALAAVGVDQRALDPHGILEGDIGAAAPIGRHRMDRVAEQGDPPGGPWRNRHGAADRKTGDRRRIGESHEVTKDRRPALHRPGGGGRQHGGVGPFGLGKAEFLVLRAQCPHQVAARVLVKVSGSGERRLVAADAADRAAGHFLHRNKESEPAISGDEADAVEERPRDAVPRHVEEDLAGDADHARVYARCLRQELTAYSRTAAVGGDEDVAFGRAAIREIRDDISAMLFIALEGLAEMDVIEPGQQHLAHGDPARGAMAGDRVGIGDEVAVDREQKPHFLGEETHRPVRHAAGALEGVE
jgi:hypothetical protein